MIKILSEKVLLNTHYSIKFINYSNNLTDIAKRSNGFISSKSYIVDNIDQNNKIDNNIKIITISEWKNNNAWHNWKNSQDRKNISDFFKDLDRTEQFKILYDRTANDIFLL